MRKLLWLSCVAVAAKGTHSHVDTAYTERGDAGSALHRRLQTCDPSSWPDVDEVCGACKALVNWESYGSTCGGYCSGIGLTCVDDANVVCQQLFGVGALEAPDSAHFGRGSGPIWMDDLECVGDESALWLCDFDGWGDEDCGHDDKLSASFSTDGRQARTLLPTLSPTKSHS